MSPPPHASEILVRVGRALYGEEWVAPMARALSLNERTLRRLKSAVARGEAFSIAPALMVNAAVLLRAHADALLDLAEVVDECGAPPVSATR